MQLVLSNHSKSLLGDCTVRYVGGWVCVCGGGLISVYYRGMAFVAHVCSFKP